MGTLTNPKLASLDPAWAAFRGFTLLFDNPGVPLGMGDTGLASVTTDLRHPLYEGLADSLLGLGEGLSRQYLFCPLPSASYHVTVCDGGHDANCGTVNPGCRAELESFLADLPASICTDAPFSRRMLGSELTARKDWNIRLEFDDLASWSGVSLVACLRPADADSAGRMRELIAARERLCAQLVEQFGIYPPEVFVPHVTLGYFGNRDDAGKADQHLDDWRMVFGERSRGRSICFSGVSLYGFTDMATYTKRKNRVV